MRSGTTVWPGDTPWGRPPRRPAIEIGVPNSSAWNAPIHSGRWRSRTVFPFCCLPHQQAFCLRTTIGARLFKISRYCCISLKARALYWCDPLRCKTLEGSQDPRRAIVPLVRPPPFRIVRIENMTFSGREHRNDSEQMTAKDKTRGMNSLRLVERPRLSSCDRGRERPSSQKHQVACCPRESSETETPIRRVQTRRRIGRKAGISPSTSCPAQIER
jgi:hypothetical protein